MSVGLAWPANMQPRSGPGQTFFFFDLGSAESASPSEPPSSALSFVRPFAVFAAGFAVAPCFWLPVSISSDRANRSLNLEIRWPEKSEH